MEQSFGDKWPFLWELHPAVLSNGAEQQSCQAIKQPLDLMWFKMTAWCTHKCALRETLCSQHLEEGKAMIKLRKFTHAQVKHTCRWCRRSLCRSHSSQCPAPFCRNVFCWKAHRWHIRGTRGMCCCMFICVTLLICQVTSLSRISGTRISEYASLLPEIIPDHFLMNYTPSNKLPQLCKPWLAVSLRA